MKKIIGYRIFFSQKGGGSIELILDNGQRVEESTLSASELSAIILMLNYEGNTFYNPKKGKFKVVQNFSSPSETLDA